MCGKKCFLMSGAHSEEKWLGLQVKLCGLSSVEHNGLVGIVEAYDSEAKRYCVRVDEKKKQHRFKLKESNLSRYHDDSKEKSPTSLPSGLRNSLQGEGVKDSFKAIDFGELGSSLDKMRQQFGSGSIAPNCQKAFC